MNKECYFQVRLHVFFILPDRFEVRRSSGTGQRSLCLLLFGPDSGTTVTGSRTSEELCRIGCQESWVTPPWGRSESKKVSNWCRGLPQTLEVTNETYPRGAQNTFNCLTIVLHMSCIQYSISHLFSCEYLVPCVWSGENKGQISSFSFKLHGEGGGGGTVSNRHHSSYFQSGGAGVGIGGPIPIGGKLFAWIYFALRCEKIQKCQHCQLCVITEKHDWSPCLQISAMSWLRSITWYTSVSSHTLMLPRRKATSGRTGIPSGTTGHIQMRGKSLSIVLQKNWMVGRTGPFMGCTMEAAIR